MTHKDIDEVVAAFVNGAVVSRMAGFKGCQLHAAHGFLLSQFLSPHTNRREDEYGGNPKRRLALLKRLVTEIRNECPRPYCLSVKLNSADYMAEGYGLSQDEGLEQVRWLADCGEVDFVEISGGNAENKTSKLHSQSLSSPFTNSQLKTALLKTTMSRFLWQHPGRKARETVRVDSNSGGLLCRFCGKSERIEF